MYILKNIITRHKNEVARYQDDVFLFSASNLSVSDVVGIEGLWSGNNVPSSQLRIMLPPRIPMRCAGKILRRSRRRSRSLFLGNMPDTACRMICMYACVRVCEDESSRGSSKEANGTGRVKVKNPVMSELNPWKR